jgi:hypothetical protein
LEGRIDVPIISDELPTFFLNRLEKVEQEAELRKCSSARRYARLAWCRYSLFIVSDESEGGNIVRSSSAHADDWDWIEEPLSFAERAVHRHQQSTATAAARISRRAIRDATLRILLPIAKQARAKYPHYKRGALALTVADLIRDEIKDRHIQLAEIPARTLERYLMELDGKEGFRY